MKGCKIMYYEKRVFWFYEGVKYWGTARLNVGTDSDSEEKYISMDDDKHHEVVWHLEESDIENGMTIEEIWDEIPEDITDFELC